MTMPSSPDLLDKRLWEEYSPAIRQAMLTLFAAKLSKGDTKTEVLTLANILSEMTATSDLMGRVAVSEAASKAIQGADLLSSGELTGQIGATGLPPAGPPPPITLPGGAGGALAPIQIGWGDVTFREAVEQIAERAPEVARNAKEIATVYQNRGFAMAKSADLATTERIQKAITKALAEGQSTREAVQEISRLGAETAFGDWSDAYSRTVFRNASTTAYTAGTFQQLTDPAISAVMVALEFDAAMDTRTTPVCRAFHGTIAAPADPIWNKRSPPCHHNCRSTLILRDRYSLARQGRYKNEKVVPRIPALNVQPAPGFGTRQDIGVYGPRI